MISFSLEKKTALLAIADENPENKFGIENLKLVQEWKASLILEIYHTIKKHKEARLKGKKGVTAWILLNYWNEVQQLVKVIQNIEQITNEFQDLTNQETIDLNDYFKRLIQSKVPSKDLVIIEKIDLLITFVADGVLDILDLF
jgi:hypothetical protein